MGDLLLESFPGLASMPNWHPLLVHFPIALLTCYLLLDVAGAALRNAAWRRMAGGLLYLGTCFAAVAVVLGVQAAQSVSHGGDVHGIMLSHGKHGLVVLGMALLLSLWRRFQGERWSMVGTTLHLALAGVMVLVMAHGADLGGLMVYGHGVGVHGVAVPPHDHDHDHAHEHDDGAEDHHH
ncbi:DUF2231 domain-containing protein [Methylogaea oryzae]|uniref:DUF2231 domain-containing protein n=1 Tax=Methylogaea oryzae TaxID=1295382 RepID=A0A8D4VMY6_9GAMM|nr:DUF2231 domain-containing protein [Methylogaea oryzae]BBL70462.1 hypothetical protein MoryE10_10680 [Methylogaea oryzae]